VLFSSKKDAPLLNMEGPTKQLTPLRPLVSWSFSRL
jgi:hypothetical protein